MFRIHSGSAIENMRSIFFILWLIALFHVQASVSAMLKYEKVTVIKSSWNTSITNITRYETGLGL